MKKSKYSILIICEGEKTEPLFFNSIKDEILNGSYDIDSTIKILPEPVIAESVSTETPSSNIRVRRQIKKSIGDEPEILNGEPPLRWVQTGHRELKDGTYNEVWVVFDGDNHPTTEEAFKLAEKEINGKKINIAFSSRSFEYYLLIHFERIFKVFNKTDCKERKKIINCGTNNHPKDCGGRFCINGYSRLKGYWDNSKGDVSTFHLIKDKLRFGFENATWLRHVSDKVDGGIPTYNRNPYLTTDLLVKRLTGYNDFHWHYISYEGSIKGIQLKLELNNEISVRNDSSKTYVVLPESLYSIEIKSNRRINLGERIVLKPNETYKFTLDNKPSTSDHYYGFEIDKEILLFDFLNDSWKIRGITESFINLTIKEMISLSKILNNNLDI